MDHDPQELKAGVERHREAVSRDLEVIGEHVRPSTMARRGRRRVRQRWHDLRDRLMGAAEQAESSVGEAVGGVRDGMSHELDRVGEGVSQLGHHLAEAPDRVQRRTAGSPVAVGFVAFGIGMLVAALLPPTEVETGLVAASGDELAGARESIGSAVHESVDEVVADLREPARQAVDDVRERAGQAVSGVVEDGRDQAAAVIDAAGNR